MTLSNPAQYISGRTVQEQMNSLIDYVDQRAAEVAADAIAADVAQVHQDMLDADADATAAAASAAAAAGTLANAVKKTGEASQSIAGDIAVTGALSGGSVSSYGNVDGASIGSGTTPITAGNLTAYGSVSLDDTTLQGNLSAADPSALINLGGAGSVLVPTPTSNSEAATKKYVDDALDNYAPMVRDTGNKTVAGFKQMMDLGFIPHMSKASNTYYRWFSVPNVDGTYYLTASIANRTASAIDLFAVTVSSGSVTTITKTTLCQTSVNSAIKMGAFTEDGKIIFCIHLDANNQYICPVMLGFHGNYGDTVTITKIDIFSSIIGADYQEAVV